MQTEYIFRSTSLLVVYEGDTKSADYRGNVGVWMIDFAHVTNQNGIDQSYLDGLRSVLHILENLPNSGNSSDSFNN